MSVSLQVPTWRCIMVMACFLKVLSLYLDTKAGEMRRSAEDTEQSINMIKIFDVIRTRFKITNLTRSVFQCWFNKDLLWRKVWMKLKEDGHQVWDEREYQSSFRPFSGSIDNVASTWLIGNNMDFCILLKFFNESLILVKLCDYGLELRK
jgi:hypothetical protein